MSTVHIIQTVIEVVIIALIIVGLIYEPIIAKWEQRQGEKMLKAFKKMRGYRK